MEEKLVEDDSSRADLEHGGQVTDEANDTEVRRSSRQTRLPSWHSDYVMASHDTYCLLTEEGEPSTFQEALNGPDASLWMIAMQEEMEALHRNHTWELVPPPKDRKSIGNKWVYKIKRDGNDQVERYRARLVVKGYAQKAGIDFNEIFSPVVRLTTISNVCCI